ncbi:MAG: PAS domain-containing sensor histidine kinase [Ancalomicrobiaceae bacterium]|nr:PAS domain-containing sensor histidine kinase [Ancalomicrobiaceae bacterium]
MNSDQPILTIPKHVTAPLGAAGRKVRAAGLITVVIALASVIASFLILTDSTPITPTEAVVSLALTVNGILLILLAGLIAWEAIGLFMAWKTGRAAARLHWQIIALFSIIATAPAVLLAIMAWVTLDRGLDRWFETRTRTIVENSASVGNAYLLEHTRALRGDAIAMATDIDRAEPIYENEPSRFDAIFQSQAALRIIPAAFLIKRDGTIVTKVLLDDSWSDLKMPPEAAMADAESGEPVVISPGSTNQVGAVMKLKEYDDLYLYVARPLAQDTLHQVRLAQEAADDYRHLEQSRTGAQLAFGVIFIGVAFILLLAAVWLGIGFANRLVAPIRRLILAADYVSKGNLAVQVPVRPKEGDLAHLGATFNTMTTELRLQRAKLVEANSQLDRRRRFTEAVLAGVTASVIGVDADDRLTLLNRSAQALLDTGEVDSLGRPVAEVVPEVSPLLAEARSTDGADKRQWQIAVRRAGMEHTVAVRITNESDDGSEQETDGGSVGSLVVTLDDITDLVTAQRSSAWADIARRIAHEIKNPLTPIQLSAERIRRRYSKYVGEDHQVFDQCVDTIIRQVGDIERMVNEFSSLARMPKPQMDPGNIADALKEAVFLQGVGHPDTEFVIDLGDEPLVGRYDQRLLSQAFTNIVKNAAEAVEAVPAAIRGKGRVEVRARRDGRSIVVDVIDNGIGLPTENRHRLLEPYVTTREKGTGLGLAIVRKIMEDHGGRIELLDAPAAATGGRGALMRLTLPASDDRMDEPGANAAPKPPPAAEVPPEAVGPT